MRVIGRTRNIPNIDVIQKPIASVSELIRNMVGESIAKKTPALQNTFPPYSLMLNQLLSDENENFVLMP